jgi:hypothetical protein
VGVDIDPGLRVRPLREGVDFYSRFARLDLTEKTGKTAFLTGGLEHHWLRLEEGSGQGRQADRVRARSASNHCY